MGNSDYLVPETHEGLSIVSLRLKGGGILTRLKNYFGFKKRLKKFLDQANNADAIILNALPINASLYIKKYQNGIKLSLLLIAVNDFRLNNSRRESSVSRICSTPIMCGIILTTAHGSLQLVNICSLILIKKNTK